MNHCSQICQIHFGQIRLYIIESKIIIRRQLMMEKLMRESLSFMNDLYLVVEDCTPSDILTRITYPYSPLLFILHHLRNKNIQPILNFYTITPHHHKHQFYQNLLALYRYQYNSSLCTQIIKELIALEVNKEPFLSLLPEEIFREVTNVNEVGYRSRRRGMEEMDAEVERVERIQDCSRGYAEIAITASIFLQQGVIKKSQEQTWNLILNIIGKYDLDFDKVSSILLTKAIDFLHRSQEPALALLTHIPLDTFIRLIIIKIYRPNNYQPPSPLVYLGPLPHLSTLTPLQLFQTDRYFYCPNHIHLIRLLLESKIYSLEQLFDHFYSLRAEDLNEIERKREQAGEGKVEEVFNYSFGRVDEGTTVGLVQLEGQAFHCFKLALMTEYIRCNNFLAFKQIYQSFGVGHFDLILHLPLVREFCLLIQWMIHPLYASISYDAYFKSQSMAPRGQAGYFKQHWEMRSELLIELLEILEVVGINVGFQVKTLIKLARLFGKVLDRNYFKIEWTELAKLRESIEDITKLYLFPASTLSEYNCSLAHQMQFLLQQFSQHERFQIYLHYYPTLMIKHPYLALRFQLTNQQQQKVLNKYRFTKLHPKAQARLFMLLHNQPLQISHFLIKRVLSPLYANQAASFASIISTSPLAPDATLFLVLSHLAPIPEKQEKMQLLREFAYLIIRESHRLELSCLVGMALRGTNEANRRNDSNSFQCNLGILKLLLERAFPNPVEHQLMKLDLEFLTFGYHLKLDNRELIPLFLQHNSLRSRLLTAITAKIITADNTQHPIFYYLLQTSTTRIAMANRGLEGTAKMVDECMQFMSTLCRFLAYEMERVRGEHPNRVIQVLWLSEDEVGELVRGEQKISMGLACILMRALRKHDLFSASSLSVCPLRKLWDRIHKDVNFRCQWDHGQINPSTANSFLHSDFYFYFWTSDLENICDLSKAYRKKIDELRNIISTRDPFQARGELEKDNKAKYVLTFELIEKERQSMKYYFDKTTENVVITGSRNTRGRRFAIPSFLKEKIEDFTTLFFIQCLLPRLTTDLIQAIFCSKVVFRVIKDSELPSNKKLLMIFTLIQAAISYVPHSTIREVKSLSVFTSDFLRIFAGWDKQEEIVGKLAEVGLEKFTPSRYEILKKFLKSFQERVVEMLVRQLSEGYIVTNCLLFLESCQYLPLSRSQCQRILHFVGQVKFQEMISLKRISSIFQARSNRLPSFEDHIDLRSPSRENST